MTPLSAFLLMLLLAAVAVIIYLLKELSPSGDIIISSSGEINKNGYRTFMTDRECQKEFEAHKPNVTPKVLRNLKLIQAKYIAEQGIEFFQNLSGISNYGKYIEGYSARCRVKEGNNYRVIYFSYNSGGDFYSIQDTGNYSAGVVNIDSIK